MAYFFSALFAIIFVLNLIILDAYIFNRHNSLSRPTTSFECGADCQQRIDDLVSQKLAALPASATSPHPSSVPTIIKVKSQPKAASRAIQYIPLPGQGSTLENKWVDLPGTEFYLSTNDYPDLSETYFEANMKLVNGNGKGFVRLFDVTAGIEVWGSEIFTSSQSFASVSSGKLTIRQGTHLYRIQAKSLTADTTVFNSGRLKLILLN